MSKRRQSWGNEYEIALLRAIEAEGHGVVKDTSRLTQGSIEGYCAANGLSHHYSLLHQGFLVYQSVE